METKLYSCCWFCYWKPELCDSHEKRLRILQIKNQVIQKTSVVKGFAFTEGPHRGSSQRSEVNYFNQVSGEVWDSTSHIWIHAKLIHIIINLWRQKAALNQSGIPCCFSYRNSLQYLSDPLFWSTLSVRAGKLNFSRQMMLTIRWVSETRSTNTRHKGAFSWEAVTNELAYLSDATGFHDNDERGVGK